MSSLDREKQVVPVGAWVAAGILFVLAFGGLNLVFFSEAPYAPFAVRAVVPILAGLVLAAYVVAIGYVYGDARRRGMRYVVWTLLAIFVPNGIGILLYFLLRDPFPVFCPNCGAGMQQNHRYCPSCGRTSASACPGCHRATQPGWTHCAWCGAKV
jgi:hypothetical protein